MNDKSETASAESILQALRMHKAELRQAGIRRLSFFGSAGRGDARANSDIDLAAELNPQARVGLPDRAGPAA